MSRFVGSSYPQPPAGFHSCYGSSYSSYSSYPPDYNANYYSRPQTPPKEVTPGTSFVVDGCRVDVGQMIGKGVYGNVFRVHLHRGYYIEKLCLKAQPYNQQTRNQINEEMEVMRRIKATFGTQFLMTDAYSFPLGSQFCFLMEEFGCSLLKILERKTGPFELPIIQTIGYQILSACSHLHSIGLIHCDIKPSNVLVNSDRSGIHVKLSDFGNTCRVEAVHRIQFKNCIQATWYRPPEVYLGLPQNHKADIWAIGCVLAEMYTGDPLFVTDEECYLLASQHFILTGIPSNAHEGRFYSNYYTKDGDLVRPYTRDELIAAGKTSPKISLGPRKQFDRLEQIVAFGRNAKMRALLFADYEFIHAIRAMLSADVSSRADSTTIIRSPFFYFKPAPMSYPFFPIGTVSI